MRQPANKPRQAQTTYTTFFFFFYLKMTPPTACRRLTDYIFFCWHQICGPALSFSSRMWRKWNAVWFEANELITGKGACKTLLTSNLGQSWKTVAASSSVDLHRQPQQPLGAVLTLQPASSSRVSIWTGSSVRQKLVTRAAFRVKDPIWREHFLIRPALKCVRS